MQELRSIVERVTAQALIPLITLGVSGAIAATLIDVLQNWRAELVPGQRGTLDPLSPSDSAGI